MKPLITSSVVALAVVIVAVVPIDVRAQGSIPVGSSSQLGHLSQTADVPHRAADAYNRGIRDMRKAADTKDPADKKKHYAAAQVQFKKSLSLLQNFDALLGLGQADLALGDNEGARVSCHDALGLKPASEEAKFCIEIAQGNLAPAPAKPPS